MRAHQDLAVRVAATIVGWDGDPEAVAQEAFVKAHAALGRFDRERPLRPWLVTIIANEARNARRGARRHRRALDRLRWTHAGTGAAPDPAWTVALDDDRRRLWQALEGLRERDRDVLVCRYLLDLSETETAAVLGVRPGTVKSRRSRALDRLREALAADGPGARPGSGSGSGVGASSGEAVAP